MRYAGIIKNDVSAGSGVCVTFFVQGCPIRCPGCHNPQTWDFEGGKEFSPEVINEVLDALVANGVQRNFCIMGGEPLCQENQFLTYLMLEQVRKTYPDIKVWLWTGYEWDDILKQSKTNAKIKGIIEMVNYMICGPFKLAERDITLAMMGSRNQYIVDLKDYK